MDPRTNITILAAVFENSPYSIVINHMSDGTYVAGNPAFIQLSGFTEDEFIGRTPDELGFSLIGENSHLIIDTLSKSGRVDNELAHCVKRNGMVAIIQYSSAVVVIDNESYIITTAVDVTDKHNMEKAAKLDELRMQSLLLISQYIHSSMQELLDFALNEIVSISSSEYGYIFHYNEESEYLSVHAWSSAAMIDCSVDDPPHEYILKNTGIWGEPVRQRKPIVINDFPAINPLKKGFPSGHVSIKRFMSIPVFIDGKIVAVVGVANKNTDYTDADVRQLTLMMDSVWKIVNQKRAIAALALSEEEYRKIVKTAPIGIFQTTVDGHFVNLNPALARMLRCDTEDDAKQHYSDLSTTLYTSPVKRRELLEVLATTDEFVQTQISLKCKDGSIIETELYIKAVRNGQDILYLEGFIEDISPRVAAEKERKALEEHKRSFYRDTILSVTDGKLVICDPETIEPYLAAAETIATVREAYDAATARHMIEAICSELGIRKQALDGLMIGIGEAITNSIKHAEYGIVSVGNDGQEVWIAVTDYGSGIESLVLPQAILKRGFSTKPSMGLGYSIMLESADRMMLKTDITGTTVVLIKSIMETMPPLNSIPDIWDSALDL